MKSLDHEACQRAIHHANQPSAGELHPPIKAMPPNLTRAIRELLRMKPAR